MLFAHFAFRNKTFVSFLCFSDGAGRSGTFIAISILMEQLKLEHSIDVFQTIKKIRSTRPEFVQNEVRCCVSFQSANITLENS